MALAAHGLAVTTSVQYDRLFGHFVDYCAGEGIEALPATTDTVIAYVGHMAELGTLPIVAMVCHRQP